ncbi:MAG: Glu/Leu/Phe/Val dehydrogenase dimerization domain-containing protein [Candidatus Aminicenantales bacterium]
MTDLARLSPLEFVDFLRREKIRRFCFVSDSKGQHVRSSHPQLQPLAEFIQNDRRDFAAHEGLFFQVTERYDTLQGAFVHRTCRGQAAGGVRYWTYDTVEDYLRDGLRLAKGMTHKNALAGLWWGGGKGVMARRPDVNPENPEIRKYLYSEYGLFISLLQGCYVTAEDVGTTVADIANVFSRTRFTTCIPEEWGGSGNPSIPTACGILSAMEAALEFLGRGGLKDKIIAIQGTGNVGGPLIRFLVEKGVGKIVACDIDTRHAEALRQTSAGLDLDIRTVSCGDDSIFREECDIFSPNATGAILNPRTIPLLKTKIVCGAANNQLEDPNRDDAALFDRGIVYVPDFLANRMGIVNAANEQYGYVTDDPLSERHLSRDWEHSVFQTTLRVLDESKKSGMPTGQIAVRLAEMLSLEPHPIFGHRGRQIIDSLVADRWAELT